MINEFINCLKMRDVEIMSQIKQDWMRALTTRIDQQESRKTQQIQIMNRTLTARLDQMERITIENSNNNDNNQSEANELNAITKEFLHILDNSIFGQLIHARIVLKKSENDNNNKNDNNNIKIPSKFNE